MAFRHRREYDESVPRGLHSARQAYDDAIAQYELAMADARRAWAAALASAIDAGMSYQEIADEVGVSHTSISRAIKQYGSD
jgi:predicted transcriptional regulator